MNVVAPPLTDKVAVLLATARTVSLMVKDGHFSIFQLGWLWNSTDRCNPVAGLRRSLLRAGVLGDLSCWQSGHEVLEQPLLAEAQVREAWLQQAQCRRDMAKVAAGRPKLKLGEQAIQWGWIHGQMARLRLQPDRLAALIGVMVGDAVPERHASGHADTLGDARFPAHKGRAGRASLPPRGVEVTKTNRSRGLPIH